MGPMLAPWTFLSGVFITAAYWPVTDATYILLVQNKTAMNGCYTRDKKWTVTVIAD